MGKALGDDRVLQGEYPVLQSEVPAVRPGAFGGHRAGAVGQSVGRPLGVVQLHAAHNHPLGGDSLLRDGLSLGRCRVHRQQRHAERKDTKQSKQSSFHTFLLSAGHTGPVCRHIPATACTSGAAGHCRDVFFYIISEQTELSNHFDPLLWHLCTVQMFCHERKSWRRAFHLSRAFSITEGWSRPPAAEPKV